MPGRVTIVYFLNVDNEPTLFEEKEDCMLSPERALKLIQDSIASLRRVGLIEADLTVTGNTVLLGTGSPLDSIAFVTFVTDVEERLGRETNQELYLVLTDIHEFNTDAASLSADILARYMVKLTTKEKA